jgi:hypothetical protein
MTNLTPDARAVAIVAIARDLLTPIDTAGAFDRRGAPERDGDGLGINSPFYTVFHHRLSFSRDIYSTVSAGFRMST